MSTLAVLFEAITNSKIAPESLFIGFTQYVGPDVNVPPGSTASADMSCPDDETLIGGGNGFSGVASDFRFIASFAVVTAEEQVWRVVGFNDGTSAMTIDSIVQCVPAFPPGNG